MGEEENGLDVETVQMSFQLSPGYVCLVNLYTSNLYTSKLEIPAVMLRMSGSDTH